MTNNLQVKDANNVTKEIHTIEDSTSAHYNMSIPITVSGIPIFTTAAPGVVSLADSVVGVSISPTQANIPVSIAGTPTVNAVQSGTWDTNASVVGRVSVFVDQVPFNVSINNTLPIPVSIVGGTLTIADNAPVSVRGGVLGAVSLGGGSANIGTVSISPTQGTIPVSVVNVATVSINTVNTGIPNADGQSLGGAGQGHLNVRSTGMVFNRNSSTWDRMTGTSVGIAVLPVSIAPQTLTTHVSNIVNVSVLDKVSIAGLVGVNAGTNLIGAVSVRQVVSVVPDGTGPNFPVSIAPPTFNVPVSLAAGRVSVQGIADVSIQDNAPVSVRGGVLGAVSLGGGTAHVGRVSVFVDQTPFNVSISPAIAPIPVSVVAGRVSIQGISQVSVAGAVTVAPLTNTAAAVPAGAFFVGGTDGTNLRGLLTDTTGALAITSIKDDVSIAPQTLFVHVCNTAPGGASGSTQMVSVGGAVSLQAVQIAVRDTGGDARTPLANTGGNLLVHVCNSLPAASGITQLVSVGGAVSTQAVQIAYRDTGGDARTPLTNTTGNILVHVCNAAPGAAGGSSITVSVGGAVSTQAVPVAFRDTGGDARQPLLTTGGIQLVHVCNAAPGGSTGGGSPQVSIGGAVSVQATQIAGVDESGNARTPLLDSTGTQKVGGFTTNPEYAFTRTTDTVSYTVGDLVANTTVAGSVVPMSFPVSRFSTGGGSFMIRRARIITPNDNRTTDRAYRIHFWNVATGLSVTNGDNGVFSPTLVSAYVGYIDVPLHLSAATGAAGVGVPGGGSEINIQLAAGQVSISALLEARVSIAPTNGGIFRVGLEILQD